MVGILAVVVEILAEGIHTDQMMDRSPGPPEVRQMGDCTGAGGYARSAVVVALRTVAAMPLSSVGTR